jgi:hypothetical protein
MLGNFPVANQLVASQEGLCSMELVSHTQYCENIYFSKGLQIFFGYAQVYCSQEVFKATEAYPSLELFNSIHLNSILFILFSKQLTQDTSYIYISLKVA